MPRKYAALPYEYLDEMAVLTDEEFGRLARALLRYSSTGEESDLTGNERFFWRRVVNRELGLQQHYRELAVKRSEAGKKGMASRWGVTADNKNNEVNVQDEVKDKDKDKVYSLPSADGKRRGAASAARTERMKRDMAAMAKWTEGSARGPREAATRLSGERTSTGMTAQPLAASPPYGCGVPHAGSEFLPQAETKDMEVART
ncbi:MAG: DUF6291 domain-containing protein [Oscillospiraceae bacterium]